MVAGLKEQWCFAVRNAGWTPELKDDLLQVVSTLVKGSLLQPLFRALRVHQTASGHQASIDELTLDALTAGEVVVRTLWAGLNYKDSLAVTGAAKVVSGYPRVPGIELVGVVESSEVAGITPGEEVLVHGFQTGIEFDGGLAERVRVRAQHVMPIPAGLSALETAVLGVPGFTVAMALERFEAHGLTPAAGPIVVSGAAGAVGISALAILARAGYQTVALTRRSSSIDTLKQLGASEVLVADAFLNQTRPLEKGRFAAAIDNVGGDTLSWMLRSLLDHGQLASVGNASGIGFSCNVLPFILRQATMFGIAANAPWPVRHRLWARLATDWKPDIGALMRHVHECALDDVPARAATQIAGQSAGRTLVKFNSA